MTSAGLPHLAMTFAIVNVFPEPVTPIKTCSFSPFSRPLTNFSIACGWSPWGRMSETNLKLARSILFGFFLHRLPQKENKFPEHPDRENNQRKADRNPQEKAQNQK